MQKKGADQIDQCPKLFRNKPDPSVQFFELIKLTTTFTIISFSAYAVSSFDIRFFMSLLIFFSWTLA
jgi:hypothetical protein